MARFLNVVDWSDAKATFFVSLVAGASVPSHRDAGRDEADDGAGRRRAERVHQPGEHPAAVRRGAAEEPRQASHRSPRVPHDQVRAVDFLNLSHFNPLIRLQ